MFCSNCGTKAVQGNFFCTMCGQALDPALPVKPAAIPALEEPSKPAEQSVAAEAGASAPPVDQTIPVALGDVPDGIPESPDPPFSVSTSPKEATAEKTDAGTRHARRPRLLLAALVALTVLGILGVRLNTTASGAPPADPAQALHRLKDVAQIDLPIDDAGVDSGRYFVPLNMPQQPSTVGEDLGSVSMGSGNTIELRVSAYTLASDAAQYALWWNTSGVKEYFAASSPTDSSVAVQCGRIVIDGAWVARHTQDDTIKLLQQAYPDCTPYIPEKAAPAPAPTPSAESTTPPAESTTPPVRTQTPLPPTDGIDPSGQTVKGAFAITKFIVTDMGTGKLTMSFTAKNTTRQILTLLPSVGVDAHDASGNLLNTAYSNADVLCHTLRPKESQRISVQGDGSWPASTEWTEARVDNIGPCNVQ